MYLTSLFTVLKTICRNIDKILIAAGIGLLVYTGASLGYKYGASSMLDRVEAAQKELADYKAAQESRAKEIEVRYVEVAKYYERKREQQQAVVRTITKEVIREVEKPVYRECVLPDSGVRLINSARQGSDDPPEPAPALPIDSPPSTGNDNGRATAS